MHGIPRSTLPRPTAMQSRFCQRESTEDEMVLTNGTVCTHTRVPHGPVCTRRRGMQRCTLPVPSCPGGLRQRGMQRGIRRGARTPAVLRGVRARARRRGRRAARVLGGARGGRGADSSREPPPASARPSWRSAGMVLEYSHRPGGAELAGGSSSHAPLRSAPHSRLAGERRSAWARCMVSH
jgi:hypothetical protein